MFSLSEFTTQEVESATSGTAFVVGQIAKFVGGPHALAISTMFLGNAAWAASVLDLGYKI